MKTKNEILFLFHCPENGRVLLTLEKKKRTAKKRRKKALGGNESSGNGGPVEMAFHFHVVLERLWNECYVAPIFFFFCLVFFLFTGFLPSFLFFNFDSVLVYRVYRVYRVISITELTDLTELNELSALPSLPSLPSFPS